MDPVVVGIDLGTTNSAVAYAEAREGARVKTLFIPQLVAEGELGVRPTLPSFVYLAGDHDLPLAATRLPWDEGRRKVVGELARAQGVRVPGKMIASAKSWLCHAGVDRQAPILPWGASGESSRLSPVDAQARVLEHITEAWTHAMGTELARQDVVLTVPASFDEVARELTLEAAARAGLAHVTLLEEPQAVFYAWMDAHTSRERRALLTFGDHVLVCDVGGGTTDFTLIRAVDHHGTAAFERVAVGDHLLCGGDNIDIALAQGIEARLGKLDTVQWHGLVHACRLAKEQLFDDPSLPSRTITVLARGSKLIGDTLQAELHRAEVEELVLAGFFPLLDASQEAGSKARVGLTEFGLPYATDPAITRHLIAFLKRHHAPPIAAVVFNGGAMKPAVVRARVLDQLAAWQGTSRPRELANLAPELAVAHGAATYGLARKGIGERILGGAARAYYLGVEAETAVCVLPRGAEEGTEHELQQDFALLLNRPARFRLYSSTTRDDQPGDWVPSATEECRELPPLVTVLRMSGAREAHVHVHVRARLTEVGTMELYCVPLASDASPSTRFRLTFDLRAGSSAPLDDSASDPRVSKAVELVRAAFSAAKPSSLMKDLETLLEARRDEWSVTLVRVLWDAIYACEASRVLTADIEARWINLCGFLLRPGTGAPLDEWRAKEIWKFWNTGLRHDRDEACRLAWWILWRRIAGGLTRGQQEQIYDRVAPLFLPGTQQKSKWFKAKPSREEAAEMWRTVASLERLSPAAKTKLGEALLDRLENGRDLEVGFWALGRLGARMPLYGPANAVIPPEIAERWIERILTLTWEPRVAFSAAQLGRRTGDRARDIDDALRIRLAARLRTLPGGDRAARLIEEVVELLAVEEKIAFGDSLPSGLRRVVSVS